MAGRPTIKKADIPALQKLKEANNLGTLFEIDLTPVITFIMFKSGCTYAEIGQVLGLTRQGAEYNVKQVEERLEKA